MTYPGPVGTSPYGRWPVTSDPGPRAPQADPVAACLLILAGTAGVIQLFVPWISIGGGLEGSYTGWDLFKVGRDQSLNFSGTVATWSLPAVAVAGGALVLLGLAMFAPINHRPLGAVGLVLALVMVIAAVWWMLESRSARGGVGEIFALGQFGWYLFLAAGPVGLVGSGKALATG